MGYPARDLVGQVFGLVTVIARAGGDAKGALWLVQCECGQRRVSRAVTFKVRAPTTHIACAKARWAERESQLERERESRGKRDLELARIESQVRR